MKSNSKNLKSSAINEYKLNKKLAEWAKTATYPDFTQSLSDCFKYLVPKLSFCSVYYSKSRVFAQASIKLGDVHVVEAKSPTLALCLAIEELIDEEIDVQLHKVRVPLTIATQLSFKFFK